MRSRRAGRCLLIGPIVVLAGCAASTPFNLAFDSLHLALTGGNNPAITRATADRVPYASMLVAVGNARPALVVLANANDLQRSWVSADKTMLITQSGRLIKTVGFKNNLVGVHSLMTDPVQTGLHRIGHGSRYSRSVDLMPGYHIGAQAESEFHRGDVEAITILGITRQLLHVTETLRLPELRFQARNDYWVDPNTGFVWQSRQHLGPDLPPVFLAIAKPFHGDLSP